MPSKKIVYLFCWFVFVSTSSCKNKQDNNTPAGTAVKDYPIITLTPRSTTLSSDFPASIEGEQNVEIRPMIDGYIEKIYVDEGATVRQGQQLFRIRAPQYEQEVRTAEANIKIAQADVNAAQMQVNKVRPLVEKNIISRYELEGAEFKLESSRAALAQAQATLANARTNLAYTIVTSPVDGVIGTLPLKIGSLVSRSTAQPLTTISDVSNIYAYFSINEKQALSFAANVKGATSEDRLRSLPPVTLVLANGEELPQKGRIETTSGQINSATGAVRVRATFPNPNNMVRSGSSGIVRIPVTVENALLVPQKSTYEIQGKKFVYLLDSSGKVNSTEIRIRPNSGGQFFVVEDGLKAGDKIVLEGVASLREGAEVKPRPVNVDSLFTTQG
ncbi:MAG: efflux RND transporter periplasmic adaptor subunit [Chitinophagaceae bacterium]|nr:MAG: efflux RND transporter periplasmic adaptor subunit [Chitinophagaceae bacterium]